jgi:hypothetical protein
VSTEAVLGFPSYEDFPEPEDSTHPADVIHSLDLFMVFDNIASHKLVGLERLRIIGPQAGILLSLSKKVSTDR